MSTYAFPRALMGNESLRAIIVDDETLGRRGVRQQLERHPEILVLGECSTGAHAARAIATHDPDIVFLDVQMPGGGGFDVLEQIGAAARPAVIFVTAFSEHAVKAFEVNAVDYVLKPVDDKRFDQALERARERLRSGNTDGAERVQAAVRTLSSLSLTVPGARRVAIREGDRTVLVRVDEIDWLEAAGNYVRVHAGRRKILTRATLSSLAAALDDSRFLQVHRSAIVNRDAITEIHNAGKGLYRLALREGTRVETSYHYRSAIAPLLET